MLTEVRDGDPSSPFMSLLPPLEGGRLQPCAVLSLGTSTWAAGVLRSVLSTAEGPQVRELEEF